MLRNKRLLIALPFAVFGVLFYWGYSWWQAPVATTVTPTQSTTGVLGSETSLRDWQTEYFQTRMPSYLLVRTSNENAAAAIMESYLLASSAKGQQDQVGVTVGMMGENSLDEISAVRLRLNDPAEYTPASRNYAPPGAFVFSHVGNYETDIIWQNGSRYAAVVVSGSIDRQPNLEQTLSTIVSNWQWL